MTKTKTRRSKISQRESRAPKKDGAYGKKGRVRHHGVKLRGLKSINEYEPTISLLKASFDPDFIRRVRENIENPEIIEGMHSEVCGAMNADENLRLSHDPSSANNKNENGFQKGGVETSPEGKNQFCHPKKHSSRILWHSHPRGVPAYPSGSDIFVTMIKDCSETDTAQAYIEFLFTEHGFWVIHRKVTPENTLVPAIDISKKGGKGIKMREIETMITKLEDNSIRPEYFRDHVPKKEAAEKISKHLMKLTYKNLAHLCFYPWGTEEFDIPEVLFSAPVTNTCIKE